VNRNFRLKNSADFKRVRRFGKSYAHPLVVLVVLPAVDQHTQIGIIAGRTLGNAVQRNHVKRMLREALKDLLPQIRTGWKIILISREKILNAEFLDIQETLNQLFIKADLLSKNVIN
jgi:ribonuclease P protein component